MSWRVLDGAIRSKAIGVLLACMGSCSWQHTDVGASVADEWRHFEVVFGKGEAITTGNPRLSAPFASAEELLAWARTADEDPRVVEELRPDEVIEVIPSHLRAVEDGLGRSDAFPDNVLACMKLAHQYRQLRTTLALQVSLAIEKKVVECLEGEAGGDGLETQLAGFRVRGADLLEALVNEARIVAPQCLSKNSESAEGEGFGNLELRFIELLQLCETLKDSEGEPASQREAMRQGTDDPQSLRGQPNVVTGPSGSDVANVAELQDLVSALSARWLALGVP